MKEIIVEDSESQCENNMSMTVLMWKIMNGEEKIMK